VTAGVLFFEERIVRQVLLLLGLITASSLWAAEPAKKQMPQKEAEGFVFRRWRQETVVEAGKSREGGLCFRFAADGGDSWCWQGELGVSGPRPGQRTVIDAAADPMRIDFHVPGDDGKVAYVIPCVWRVEGTGEDAKLVIVQPDGSEKPRKHGDYGNSEKRPTGFEATKENKYTKVVHVPCKPWEQVGDRQEKPGCERVSEGK
jgi:hypothetical protein